MGYFTIPVAVQGETIGSATFAEYAGYGPLPHKWGAANLHPARCVNPTKDAREKPSAIIHQTFTLIHQQAHIPALNLDTQAQAQQL